MGDVAMVVPVLSALNQNYPNVKISVLTRHFYTPFFRSLPNVSVVPAEVNGRHKGVLGLYKLSRELKALHIDAVADLHLVLRSHILKFFLPVKPYIQIDKGRAEKKALVSGKKYEQLKTTHQRYADVFGKLGLPIDLSNPVFPKKVDLKDALLRLIGKTSKKRIGIAPFAAHQGKMYPLNLIKEVIASLSKNYSVVLFGGGKKEIAVLNQFEAEFKNVVSVAGKLNLNEELDVISNLDVMLAMDSGNAHIAAMLGIKVITIWGVTHPFAGFAPFNQPQDYALLPDLDKYPKIPTSIYGNTYPEGYEKATASIAPLKIIEKIKSVI